MIHYRFYRCLWTAQLFQALKDGQIMEKYLGRTWSHRVGGSWVVDQASRLVPATGGTLPLQAMPTESPCHQRVASSQMYSTIFRRFFLRIGITLAIPRVVLPHFWEHSPVTFVPLSHLPFSVLKKIHVELVRLRHTRGLKLILQNWRTRRTPSSFQ